MYSNVTQSAHVPLSARACLTTSTDMQVSFALNGKKLGVAFEEIRVFEPQLAYFPAVSLSEGEAAYVNLGSAPFRFPIEDFKPLQAPPPASRALQCNWLLEKISLLCSV